jgi:hypothetical protein
MNYRRNVEDREEYRNIGVWFELLPCSPVPIQSVGRIRKTFHNSPRNKRIIQNQQKRGYLRSYN